MCGRFSVGKAIFDVYPVNAAATNHSSTALPVQEDGRPGSSPTMRSIAQPVWLSSYVSYRLRPRWELAGAI